MRTALLVFIFSITMLGISAQKPAYKLYDKTGQDVSYQEMLEALQQSDVVFFGEQHNNAIAHWMQLELTKDLYNAREEQLILGAEMFEADNQMILNEYLNDLIPETKIKEARLWQNYETDYKPLLEFAKDHDLPFVATNIPRRYASAVYHKGGFEALKKLSDEAKRFIAPLPVEYDPTLSVYKQMTESMPMMGKPVHGGGNKMDDLPKAQAIKDATMAYFIAENYKDGHLFLHFNGRLHSDYDEGIVWYMDQYAPELKVMTISTRKQENIHKLDEKAEDIADYILVVDEAMTDTY